MKKEQATFTWTLKVTVDSMWVADGFNMTQERAQEMVERELPFAYGHEVRVAVTGKPKDAAIARAQGYKSVKAMKAAQELA